MPASMTIFQLWYLLWVTLIQWKQPGKLKTVDDCPGYTASNIRKSDVGITADLKLAGAACDIYGNDLVKLKFEASYQTGKSTRSNLIGTRRD